MTADRKVPFQWWGAGFDVLAGIVVFILMWFELGRSALAYTSFMGYTPAPPTPAAIAEYWLRAGVILALLVFGYVVAVLQRRSAAMIAYPIVLIVTVIVVLLVAIPRIDWSLGDNVTYAPNPGACNRTDSENCPGG